jgi:Gas vesicle protein
MTSPSSEVQNEQPGGPFPGRPSSPYLPTHAQPQSLADVLERVLDKGIVIVGDIQVRLLDIELLTIKLRLLVASVDRAREMGVNWWEVDEFVTAQNLEDENGDRSELARRVQALEERMPSDDTEPTEQRRATKRGRAAADTKRS